MRLLSLLMLQAIFLIALSGIAIANDYVVLVTSVPPCNANADITIRAYTAGYLNNPAYLELQRISVLDATGTAVETIPEPGSNNNLDFIVYVTNTACDPGLAGNKTQLNVPDPENFGPPSAVDLLNIQMIYDVSLTSPAHGQMVSDNTTTFTWNENGGPLASYTLIIDDSADLGSPIITQSGITTDTYTLNPSQQLPDGTYYWAIESYHDGSSLQRTGIWSFDVLATGPIIQSITPSQGTWTSLPLSVSVTTNAPSVCGYSFTSGSFADKILMIGSGTGHTATITLPSQGQNMVYFQCNNSLGTSAEVSRIYKLDSVRPSAASASVLIEGGAAIHDSTTLSFSWSGFFDPQPGRNITGYYYSFSNGGGTSIGTYTAGASGQLTNAAQGTVNVYVWGVDAMGNYGLAATSSIIVDTMPPAFGSPSLSPSDLTKYTSGPFRICYSITDGSGLIADPTLRARIGSDAFSAPSTMFSVGGTTYCSDVTEPSGGWVTRSGETVYWEAHAIDLGGRNSSAFGNEYIDNLSTAPSIHFIPDYTIFQGNATQIPVTWYDPDPETLVLTSNITGYGGSVTQVNNTYGYLTITPTNDLIGVNPVSVQVTDGQHTRSRVFHITVINVNDPPVISAIENQYVHEYTLFNLTINATDIDGDPLTYQTNSSTFSINSQTGVITYIPTMYDRGTYAINVTVNDGNGGMDSAVFLVTVGYCGDGTCNANFESCETCEIDCLDACPDHQDSAAISISPRNCINQSMTLLAVMLVRRATCETKGDIIDDMEVCGNLTNTELIIKKYIEDGYYEVENVLTDLNGVASWTPTKPGDYKIEFQSTSYAGKYTLFTAKACTQEELRERETESGTGQQPSRPSPDPHLEEPIDLPQEKERKGYSFVYFLILPLLSIILAITVLRYVYFFEKKKPNSGYATFIDAKYALLAMRWNAMMMGLKTHPKTRKWYLLIDGYMRKGKVVILDYYRKSSRARIIFLSKMNAQKNLKIPFFDMQGMVHDKHNELIVLSILKHFRKKESVNKVLDKVEHKIQFVKGIGFSGKLSLLDIGTVCANLNLRARFENSHHSLIDIKMNAVNKMVCLCDLVYSSPIEAGKFIRSSVIITGYDKTHVIIHNYAEEKKNQRIPFAAFTKAWKNSGSTLLLISRR